MSKILVLGSNGFLGKNMMEFLAEKGCNFVGVTHEEFDLMLKDECREVFRKTNPDIVINLAAFLGGIHFGIKHAAEMFTNNMLMQLNILEACREFSVKRLINPIGSCIYPGELDVYEESKLWNGCMHESVLPFATAKKAFVVACEAYRKEYGLDSVNLVMSNMYGPGDHFDIERAHAVGGLIKRFLDAKYEKQKEIVVLGTGNPIREWLYVKDAVNALYLTIDSAPIENVLNIGEKKGYSIKETVEILKEIVGFEGNVRYDDSYPDGAMVKTVDGSRAKSVLNWEPKISFKEGLEITIRWFEEEYYAKRL